MHRARWLLLLGLFCVTTPAAALAGDDSRAGGPAPEGCWTMRDGCAARTGATHTPGVRGPLVEGWKQLVGTASEEIDDEPRVWHDRVFVTTRSGSTKRSLHVLALADGRPLAKPIAFATDRSLDISVWNESVLVRMASGTLGAYRLRGGKLERTWTVTAESAFHSPMLFDDQVYALDGSDVVSWKLGSDTPLWRAHGPYRGRLAIRGLDLYALRVDDLGNTWLVPIHRLSGRPGGKTFTGAFARQGLPAGGDLVRITALEKNVFVSFSSALRSKSTRAFRTSWLLRLPASAGLSTIVDNGLMSFLRPPVETKTGWLVTDDDPKDGIELWLSGNDAKDRARTFGYVLASRTSHPDYLSVRTPYTVAGGMMYAGGRGVELESRKVTWRREGDPLTRPVPAHDALLLVTGTRQMTALRPEGAVTAGASFLGPAHAIGTSAAPAPVRREGVVFLVDERFHEGAFELAADGTTIKLFVKRGKKEKEETHEIQRVTFALDDQQRLLYTSAPAGMRRALSRYHYLRHATAYYKFAKDAFKTADADLMGRLIAEASARGIDEKKLKFPRKQHQALITRPRKRNDKRRKKIVDEMQALAAADAALDATVLVSPLDDPRWPVQQAFIRRMLEHGDAPAKATALIKARLPAFIPPPADFKPLDWIDFVDQLQHTTARRLEKPTGERKDLTHLDREYGSALTTWRKDLVALEAGELLVLTPLAKPGRIAGCLSMGTLVTRALAEVFSGGTNVRTDPWPLILRLYESQKEYLAASTRPGDSAEDRKQMEWTGGHYSPSEGLSRIYLPERPDAWKGVMSTYAHELTHHWIEERCPLFKTSESKHLAGIPGYWIVEGMATFVEQFAWDLERRTWNTVNPRAGSFDVIANATPKQLHSWRMVYNASQPVFWRLKRYDQARKIPMRWRLGYSHIVSEAGIFYDQAAATCHYLYHAGAKERRALLDYVRQYYTGGLPPKQESIANVFGMSPEELGRRVVAYAKKMNARR